MFWWLSDKHSKIPLFSSEPIFPSCCYFPSVPISSVLCCLSAVPERARAGNKGLRVGTCLTWSSGYPSPTSFSTFHWLGNWVPEKFKNFSNVTPLKKKSHPLLHQLLLFPSRIYHCLKWPNSLIHLHTYWQSSNTRIYIQEFKDLNYSCVLSA